MHTALRVLPPRQTGTDAALLIRSAYGLAATPWTSGNSGASRCAAGRLLSVGADLRGRLDCPWKATAESDVVEARFVDIVPGRRVVQAVDFVSNDPIYAGTMTMTWEVTPVDAGTCVEIRADDVPDGISAEDHAAGLASSLANLASYLGDESPRPRPLA